jgi:hypothetical protein
MAAKDYTELRADVAAFVEMGAELLRKIDRAVQNEAKPQPKDPFAHFRRAEMTGKYKPASMRNTKTLNKH